MKGRFPRGATSGPDPVLSKAEEERVVAHISAMAAVGYPLDRRHLLAEIKKIVDADGRPTPFKDNLPGKRHKFNSVFHSVSCCT